MEYLNEKEKIVLEYLRSLYFENYDVYVSVPQSAYYKIKGVATEQVHNILKALCIRDYLKVDSFEITSPTMYQHFYFTEKALNYFNAPNSL